MRGVFIAALMVMWVPLAAAQSLLSATRLNPDQVPPKAALVLRPAPSTALLAGRVARVLELRTGRATTVGEPPPAGMLEAVPAGQVGLDGDSEVVRVLFSGADGRIATARVALSAGGRGSDPRAVALVVEALQDEAAHPIAIPMATDASAMAHEPEPPPVATDPRPTRESARFGDLTDAALRPVPREPDFLGRITPLMFVRGFTGISSSSTRPMMGAGVGLGVCAARTCALMSAEYPISSANDASTPDEVRYRYLTFASGFYARPFDLGAFTPGAGVAFVTRVGSVEGPAILDTDLGLRGTLEMAWRMLESVDILAEGGIDLALDQARSRNGYAVTYRGDTWTPWLQLAVRFCPELD